MLAAADAPEPPLQLALLPRARRAPAAAGRHRVCGDRGVEEGRAARVVSRRRRLGVVFHRVATPVILVVARNRSVHAPARELQVLRVRRVPHQVDVEFVPDASFARARGGAAGKNRRARPAPSWSRSREHDAYADPRAGAVEGAVAGSARRVAPEARARARAERTACAGRRASGHERGGGHRDLRAPTHCDERVVSGVYFIDAPHRRSGAAPLIAARARGKRRPTKTSPGHSHRRSAVAGARGRFPGTATRTTPPSHGSAAPRPAEAHLRPVRRVRPPHPAHGQRVVAASRRTKSSTVASSLATKTGSTPWTSGSRARRCSTRRNCDEVSGRGLRKNLYLRNRRQGRAVRAVPAEPDGGDGGEERADRVGAGDGRQLARNRTALQTGNARQRTRAERRERGVRRRHRGPRRVPAEPVRAAFRGSAVSSPQGRAVAVQDPEVTESIKNAILVGPMTGGARRDAGTEPRRGRAAAVTEAATEKKKGARSNRGGKADDDGASAAAVTPGRAFGSARHGGRGGRARRG